MDYSLSNADLVLLLLISEQPGVNGYGIRRLVEQRGLVAWAGVASSSIYNGLKRIEKHGLARSAPDAAKQDRGPRGQVFHLTAVGRRAMKKAVAESLATSREHDPRFNIALSGLGELSLAAAVQALEKRTVFLASEYDRLSAVRASSGKGPLSADLLFSRILHAIEAERAWTTTAIDQIQRAVTKTKEPKL